MNKRIRSLVIVGILFGVAACNAGNAQSSGEEHKVLRVIDGDTVLVEAPYLPKGLGNTLYLRVNGIDTPEKGHLAKCDKERRKSIAAKQMVENELELAKEVRLWYKGFDKYGRILGDILIDGKYLSHKLVERGYAVRYTGKGEKHDWCK